MILLQLDDGTILNLENIISFSKRKQQGLGPGSLYVRNITAVGRPGQFPQMFTEGDERALAAMVITGAEARLQKPDATPVSGEESDDDKRERLTAKGRELGLRFDKRHSIETMERLIDEKEEQLEEASA